VRSSKTEHHEGRDCRLVPLFPELLPYLRDVYEHAEPGASYVITRYRQLNANLRTQLKRIIQPGRPDAVAEALSQSAFESADGAG
jgi:hypothetical protein